MNQGLTINIDPQDAYDSNLPDLKNGTFSQRLVWFLHWLFVYIPVFICYMLVISIYLVYISTYLYFLIFEYDIANYASSETWFYNILSEEDKQSAKTYGIIQFVLSTIWVILLLVSSIRATNTNPGSIPDTSGWKLEREIKQGQGDSFINANTDLDQIDANEITPELIPFVERKKEGGPRTCEHCVKIKPDRCHHCKLCDVCILKMDHHCPWINNCVGFYNYKFFILTVLYGLISTLQLVSTYWQAVFVWISQPEISNWQAFCIFFYYSLVCKLCCLLCLFLGFHIYLMINCITTIEYCEKLRSKEFEKYQVSPYKISFSESFIQVFGKNPFYWFLPMRINTYGKGILWKVHLLNMYKKQNQKQSDSFNQNDLMALEDSGEENDALKQRESIQDQTRSIVFERIYEEEQSIVS